MEEYVGAIKSFGFSFVPEGWLACNGALISIADYEVLFALIGTTYGGNGQTNFALPDLRGRIPIGTGTRPGGSTYVLGQSGGTVAQSMPLQALPAHDHRLFAYTETGNASDPGGALRAASGELDPEYRTDGSLVNMNSAGINPVGNNLPFSIEQPGLASMYCICVQGIFPSRP